MEPSASGRIRCHTPQAGQRPAGAVSGKDRMTASRQVNRLLSAFGLQLRRLPRPPELSKDMERATRGHLVELIGPTGVGKTHFHAHLFPEIEHQWLSRRQIKPLMDEQQPFIELNGASSLLIDNLLAQKKRSIWALDLPVWRKVELVHVIMREMALDIRARTRVVPVAGVFSDEGITHNFKNELLHWHEECGENDPSCEEALREFLHGRSIIMLDADDETILRNLKRRHAELRGKQQNDLLAYWTEARILNRTRPDRRAAQNWLKLATSYGANTLMVDLREGLDAGKQKVLRFLDDIQAAGCSPDEQPRQDTVVQPKARAL
jgi:hypothetical protein